LRLFIRQAKAKGAIPVVLSPTPANRWAGRKIERMPETYAAWAKEVAKQENVEFIELNNISADKFDKMGEKAGKDLYKDSVHTTKEGAILNGESVVEGIRSITNLPLIQYLKK
jgi:unsaturated rhamnogalacturonyl hydrolase